MKAMFPALLPVAIAGFTVLAAHGQDSVSRDPLVTAVESMKRSVARLLCLNRIESEPTVLGSAFFVSSSGSFLTAAHVLADLEGQPDFCRFAVVAVPLDSWNPQLRDEFHAWFQFHLADCRIDSDLDVAQCRTIESPSIPRNGMTFAVRPAQINRQNPPDGTEVGVIGFPLGVRDPMASRASVATTRIVWREGKSYPELLLDRPSFPGSSGSAVFLPDGRVVGIVVGTGSGDTTGMTVARPGASFEKLLNDRKE